MAQTDFVAIDVRCPHCGRKESIVTEVAIAGTGADDGGLGDNEGVGSIYCLPCGETYEVVLHCFTTVRKTEDV